MNKHTPGPWSCDETPLGDDIHAIVANAHKATYDWQIVAQLSAWPDDEGDIQPATAKANARLIATAPELLSLLVRVRKLLDGSVETEDRKLVAEIDAILSKATGQEV